MLRFASILVFLCCIFAVHALCQNISFIKATVDKQRIETGELFTYIITVEGEFNNPQLNLPELKDFMVVAEAQSRNYAERKGKIMVTLTIEYKLTAAKPGTFIIGPATIKDRTHNLRSNSLTIEVSGKSLQDKQKILPLLENATEI